MKENEDKNATDRNPMITSFREKRQAKDEQAEQKDVGAN